jgi:hypothetical protein
MTDKHQQAGGRRRSVLATATAAVILLAGGVSACGVAASDQQSPPQPAVTTTAPPTPHQGTAHQASASNASPLGPTMPRSVPTHLMVPAIGVDHGLLTLGLNPDGAMHTPPLSKVAWPGWYEYSPTPGEQGPAVIVGHIDSAKKGPGVFFKLGALHKGDQITVHRKDGSTAHFTVYNTAEYPKGKAPSPPARSTATPTAPSCA